MRAHGLHRTITGLVIAAAVLAADQGTKILAGHGAATMLPAHNPSYAFGIVGGSATVLIVGSVVALGAFMVLADRFAAYFGISAFLPALVVGGMLGNTLDRVRFGSVRDFLLVPGAIINVADIAVAAGLVGLVLTLATQAPRLHAQRLPVRSR